MKPFDFNIHLPQETQDLIKSELDNSSLDLLKVFRKQRQILQKSIYSGNFMLFNQDILSESNVDNFLDFVRDSFRDISFTLLVDFRSRDTPMLLRRVRNKGIKGVKFHSYVQKIGESDFSKVLKLCRIAQENKLFICLDTSFGTSKMFAYDNLKLACFISDFIKDAPIVLLHSGGARVREAMLLAEDKNNIYLETSFSFSHYKGSGLEADFAYAYKKIGAQRVIYGSDFPYLTLEKSFNDTAQLLRKYKFSRVETEYIMRGNALQIVNIC